MTPRPSSDPAAPFVVAALQHAAAGDVAGVRRALEQGAASVGWPAVAHRLDVAGRALAFDAALEARQVPALLGELTTATRWPDPSAVDVAADVLLRWIEEGPIAAHQPELHDVPTQALVVSWLADRQGYPPQVVA